MAAENYLTVGDQQGHPFTLWWRENDPDRIHLTTNDPRFLDEHGSRPGIRIVVSSNPRSADYNPATFNRCSRALAAAGRPAPPEVEVHSRKLAERPSGTTPSLAAAAPGSVDSCPGCFALVTDLEGHLAVCPAGAGAA